jgi:drug/metabolite transporter (DMT)-like permease
MAGDARIQAFGFGLLAAFFWGTHSVIVRYLTGDIHGIPIAVMRLYIAALALYLILKLGKHEISIAFRDRTFQITTFGAITNYIFFHIGLEHTSASNAMMLENTAPFFVLVFLFLVLKEKIRPLDLVAAAIAVFGVYFTLAEDLVLAGEGLEGDLLEIGAGITWGIFLLGSSKALRTTRSTMERINFLFSVFIVSALFLTPFAFFFPFEPTANDVVFLVLLGIFPTAIAYYLWYEAAARVSAISATLLFTLSIIFTFLFAHLFFGEVLTSNMITGAVLIVVGVILSKLGAKKG